MYRRYLFIEFRNTSELLEIRLLKAEIDREIPWNLNVSVADMSRSGRTIFRIVLNKRERENNGEKRRTTKRKSLRDDSNLCRSSIWAKRGRYRLRNRSLENREWEIEKTVYTRGSRLRWFFSFPLISRIDYVRSVMTNYGGTDTLQTQGRISFRQAI